MDLFIQKYGKENIIQANLHVDEKHKYIGNGEIKTSLEHIHCLVIPEIDGKLCGKKFSSKSAMSGINKEIDKMCKGKYKCDFLTHETPQHMTVEELKAKSEAEKTALMQLADTDTVETKRKGFSDVVLSKKEYQKLTLQAEKYKQIEEKNEEIKANIETVKKAHKELQKNVKDSKTVLKDAEKVKELAQMLPTMETQKENLDEYIQIANKRLCYLQEQEQQYSDTVRDKMKYIQMEADNKSLKQELQYIKTGIERIIEVLDRNNNPISNKIKNALERLISKENNNKTQIRKETER